MTLLLVKDKTLLKREVFQNVINEHR